MALAVITNLFRNRSAASRPELVWLADRYARSRNGSVGPYDDAIAHFQECIDANDRDVTHLHLASILEDILYTPTGGDMAAVTYDFAFTLTAPKENIVSLGMDNRTELAKDFHKAFELRHYPNLYQWNDIESHPGFESLDLTTRWMFTASFNQWERLIETATHDARTLARHADAIGFDMDEILHHTTAWKHFPREQAELAQAMESILQPVPA